MRATHRAASIVAGLIAGWATATACAVPADLAICVKEQRSCEAAHECETDDDCVPAEAFDADAITVCDRGQCVWDCTEGETCPGGWRCRAPDESFGQVFGGC
jgi:hypothetical protein